MIFGQQQGVVGIRLTLLCPQFDTVNQDQDVLRGGLFEAGQLSSDLHIFPTTQLLIQPPDPGHHQADTYQLPSPRISRTISQRHCSIELTLLHETKRRLLPQRYGVGGQLCLTEAEPIDIGLSLLSPLPDARQHHNQTRSEQQ